MDVISFARGNPSPDILPVDEFGECARPSSRARGARSSTTARRRATGRCASGSQSSTASSRPVTGRDHAELAPRLQLRHAPPRVRGSRPGRGRGAELRPHDPRAAQPRRDDRRRADERRRARPRPPRDDPRGGRACRAPLHDPDVPEPVRPDALARPAARARGARRARGVLLFEDDPYGLVRFEGEPLPSSTSSPPARASSTRPRSRRRSPPACGSATVVLPRCVKPVEKSRTRPTSRRRCSSRRCCTS